MRAKRSHDLNRLLEQTIQLGRADSRPVLILSHDMFNERSGTVIAVALASQAQNVALGQFHPPLGVNPMVTCKLTGVSMESTIK